MYPSKLEYRFFGCISTLYIIVVIIGRFYCHIVSSKLLVKKNFILCIFHIYSQLSVIFALLMVDLAPAIALYLFPSLFRQNAVI